ncbi:MAG TPA: DHH family phosphoesterase [Aliicoccus persicus]|uniref:Cyclic-di-AMP phosphodiesterase n=1 Tax=Aliicoccus persicus TaxID=930138 RepID=A0A921JC07_9STAP|nr:DHH family phosphoesterase [Aliicoccus persicus]
MFKVMNKRKIYIPVGILVTHLILNAIMIYAYNITVAVIFSIVTAIIIILVFYYLHRTILDMESRLQYTVDQIVGGKQLTVDTMPVGLIVLNDNDEIEWMNNYIGSILSEDALGQHINLIFPNILTSFRVNNLTVVDSTYQNHSFRVYHDSDFNTLQMVNITGYKNKQQELEDKRPTIGILFLDNYDEVTQNMAESLKSELNNLITGLIHEWAATHNVYLRRFSQDRFLLLLNAESLAAIEETRFSLLDKVRMETSEIGAQITLSIGFGEGSDSYIDVGDLAQRSLDLALGRGGDQVAIKRYNGDARFYGGKTDPMEKRTRVRARVVSHALRDILLEGSNVIIMGHKRPDMDSIGAALGVARLAEMNGLDARIILNEDDLDETISRVMKEVEKHEEVYSRFVSSDDAWDFLHTDTTVVVVDTHRPVMVQDELILNKANRKVVIDHHRRSDDFLSNPLLVYLEPYASSASELVAELLEYQASEGKLKRIESSIMLAGIIVDTRNFTLRTGSRTFDAASFLRSNSADPVLAHGFLKDDIDTYIARVDLIKAAAIWDNGVAIVKADPTDTYHPVTVAQAADELLKIEGVKASFVMAVREDDSIGVSARSLGEMNVQLIMESLNGGGHLTNAATRFVGVSLDDAYDQLVEAINKSIEERGSET